MAQRTIGPCPPPAPRRTGALRRLLPTVALAALPPLVALPALAAPLALAAVLIPSPVAGQVGEAAGDVGEVVGGAGEPWAAGEVAGTARQRVGGDRILSINPALVVAAGVFSVDFEHVVEPGMTLGSSFFYHHAGDWDYAPHVSVDGVFRYYPSGRAYSGFAVGGLLGFTVMDHRGASRNALGLGFTGEHHWLLGDTERMGIAVGVGGKRLFYFSERERAWRALPLVRASLGWVF